MLTVNDPQKDLVDPAVNGTLTVLRSCKKAGGGLSLSLEPFSFFFFLLSSSPSLSLYSSSFPSHAHLSHSPLSSGCVKRVILTSSVAALTDSPDPNKVYTEEDWNTTSSLNRNPYYYSKTVAERAAWDFVAKEGGEMELVVANPFMVIGPEHGNPKVREGRRWGSVCFVCLVCVFVCLVCLPTHF